ncbi:hypothetical protein AFK24_03585 [Pseudomonas syringae]|uniref:DUF72 domain-containing protein n=1 Tax=Pseudomonas syringae TaxID=317 RepID=A0A1C7Z968_PSESX|nr:DUF72 domain-containing protein [Pseudomonas syringae]OCR26383.1 hypothetical protein AFK24_03585 [Pseudomonas syringae]
MVVSHDRQASPIYVGCAGWSLPREHKAAFDEQGSHLQRYASRLGAVEINSSFYRPHRHQTYVRWAESVPAGFRFAVKVPKLITHERRLLDCDAVLDEFMAQCSGLGEKLGCLLVQLPPSLAYEPQTAQVFFQALRERFSGDVVLEPRHASWLNAEDLLVEHRIGRVAADPSPIPGGTLPAGWPGVRYWRLHGSPRIYHSTYEPSRLEILASDLLVSRQKNIPSWCIFDNTASGFAVGNGLELQTLLSR